MKLLGGASHKSDVHLTCQLQTGDAPWSNTSRSKPQGPLENMDVWCTVLYIFVAIRKIYVMNKQSCSSVEFLSCSQRCVFIADLLSWIDADINQVTMRDNQQLDLNQAAFCCWQRQVKVSRRNVQDGRIVQHLAWYKVIKFTSLAALICWEQHPKT